MPKIVTIFDREREYRDEELEDDDCAHKVDKWQDKISSGFDRLMSFASTELDKRRRSTEGGDTAASCNTSPDSGIGHGDPPPAPNMSAGKSPGPKMPRLFKTPPTKSDSPPPPHLDEITGPPRTPSPSSSADEHNDGYSPANLDGPYSPTHSPPSSVPSKYQRPESEHRQRSDHHFKKKFYYRENYNSNSHWQGGNQKGKFRPKGKDWDWHSKSQQLPDNQRYRYGWEQDPTKYS